MSAEHEHPHPGWRASSVSLVSDDAGYRLRAPLNTPIDMAPASRLVGAAVAGCWDCQEEQFDEVASGDPRVIGQLARHTYEVMLEPIGRMVVNQWLVEDYVVSTLASWHGKRSLPLFKAAASSDYAMLYRVAESLTLAERTDILDGMLDVLSTWIVLPATETLAAQWEHIDAS